MYSPAATKIDVKTLVYTIVQSQTRIAPESQSKVVTLIHYSILIPVVPGHNTSEDWQIDAGMGHADIEKDGSLHCLIYKQKPPR